ncbi:unnamed protein product [Trichobilharzia szidati]|nr:unnamed protein product [Trichobilharzia szidati]
MVRIVMLSNEEQAVMRNLPALVADLESMDIIDHLTATTPPSITPADYESIIATSQREGRRAGVRCLVACLLRRTDSSRVFQSFINILKEDYRHLSDLLSSTYESLKNTKENDEPDFGTTGSSISVHSDTVVRANDPTGIVTPCQLVSKDIENSKISFKGLGHSEYDTILNIISIICSHPIAIINWKALLNELKGSTTVSTTTAITTTTTTTTTDTTTTNIPPNEFIRNHNNFNELQSNRSNLLDLQWCTSNCRRDLFHYFSVNIIRNLESRGIGGGGVGGSPFKRLQSVNSTSTVKLNHQFIRKLVMEQLIPALQRLNLWNLANRIHREIVQCSDDGDGNAGDGGGDKQGLCCSIDSNKRCSLLYINDPSLMKSFNTNHHDYDQNHYYFPSCNILKAYPQLNYAKSLLFSCVEPLFHHSLILIDWPFLLHELHVCSTCISYLIMCSSSSKNRSTMCRHNDNNKSNNSIASSNCNAASSYRNHGSSTTNQNDNNGDDDNDDEKIRNSALKIYFSTVLHNTLLQRMITEKNDNNNSCQSLNPIGHIFNESVQKSCVASVIHTQLLPALRSLDLNVLHDEIEQLAYKMLH